MALVAFEEPEFEPNSPLSWTRGEYVGGGSYGKVYKCHLEDNRILAVKIVPMEPQRQKEVEALNNEIRILKKLRHRRIVSYYGSEHKDGDLHLFMEFMAEGSLSGQIQRDGVLSEHLSKWYTKQMLEGVCFLHSHDIIHRDIKGSNVLLDSEGNVKLADFGLSKIIEKVGSKTNLGTFCGTSYWMAPEILLEKGYGRKADIWSLGCTVVEMLTGKPPLGHLNPSAAMFSIGSKPLDLTLPESVSNEAKRFIEAALTWEPDNRPWSHELQNYAFISNRDEVEKISSHVGAASHLSEGTKKCVEQTDRSQQIESVETESVVSAENVKIITKGSRVLIFANKNLIAEESGFGVVDPAMQVPREFVPGKSSSSDQLKSSRLSTKVKDMPYAIIAKICLILNVKDNMFYKDYRLLGEKMGYAAFFMRELENKENPTDALLQLWSLKPEATVQNLIALLKDTDLERMDVAMILEDWVEGKGSK